MKLTRLKSFLLIVALIAVTVAAMAYSTGAGRSWLSGPGSPSTPTSAKASGPVTLSGRLVQNKVLQGSDGRFNLALTLQADKRFDPESAGSRNVDMVIILDCSGSMKGRKISDARQAVLNLLSALTSRDRFALITYSDRARQIGGLDDVTADYGEHLTAMINSIRVGGGTNLGDGLRTGINVLLAARNTGNARKLILISDGLANKGITDSTRLGQMAGVAVEKEFAVSTLGVGTDFNEQLMATIADRGAGNYYYLENPMAFAEVFQREFLYTRATVATNVSITFPLEGSVSIVDASGYPISIHNDQAVFYPGDLHSGQTRKLFLTLQVPTGTAGSYELGPIKARYRFNGEPMETVLKDIDQIACVHNPKEVRASIDRTFWGEKVIREDYNRLKQEVAADIKAGKKQKALERIGSYYHEQESINADVGSPEVSRNLDHDLKDLRQRVEDVFKGPAAAVSRKQKSSAKQMQYEGYRGRR